MSKFDKQSQLILEKLSLANKLSISDGVKLLDITESSVRRIYSKIAEKGLATRFHGGLTKLKSASASETSTDLITHKEEKNLIANTVANYIIKYSKIFLGSGSTNYKTALALSKILKTRSIAGFRIYTNSLRNFSVLKNICQICLCSGEYRNQKEDFYGYLTENAISKLNFDLCVLSTDGLNISGNLSTTDFESARICSAVIGNSRHKILATDSSKLGKTDYVNFGKINDFDIIVTDSNAPQQFIEKFKSSGIETVIV